MNDSTPAQIRFLRTAAATFATHGYAGTSLSRLAAACGVTKGALAHHFPTKDSFLVAIAEEFSALLLAERRDSILGFPDAGLRTLVRYLSGLSRRFHQGPILRAALVLMSDRSTPPGITRMLVETWNPPLVELIESTSAQHQLLLPMSVADATEYLTIVFTGGKLLQSESDAATGNGLDLRFLDITIRGLGAVNLDAAMKDVSTYYGRVGALSLQQQQSAPASA